MAPDDGRAPPGIAYLDGRRFRRLLIAGVHNVERHRAELDRINVFPVPDGDTGTNLALTLRSIAAAVRSHDSRLLCEVVRSAAEASVLGARGNSGMLFSHLMLGFADAIGDSGRAAAADVAQAFRVAAERLRDVLDDPREGTILTVASDMAAAGDADSRGDLARWLRDVQAAARDSLARTQQLLPALTEAGVVDAGARGLVEFFEGVVQLVEGRLSADELAESSMQEDPAAPSLYAAREAGVGADEGRYCTQVAIRGKIPPTAELRSALSGLGTSTIIVRSGAVAKVHIHSDRPDDVVEVLGRFGAIASKRIEDTMLAGTARHHTAVLTDSAADLPRAWVERHGVTVIPMQVIVGDRVYRDGVDLQSDELLELMFDPANPVPKTSQPTPAAFRAACQSAVDHGAEELLGIFVSGAVSGTLASATAVLREFEVPTEAVDSRSGSLGIGLLVIRAIELLERGLPLPDVVAELRRVRDQSNVFFTVDTMEYLLRSGRIGRARAWLGGMLDLKPILTLTADGRIVPVDRARGREAVVERVLALVDERVEGAREVRFGVAHFGASETADEIARLLRSRYPQREVLVGPAAAALGVHTGPGTWALAYQIEDGGPISGSDVAGTHHASRGSQTA